MQLNELRPLAPMPAFSFDTIKNGKFFSDFDRYFNDHFAYRVGLIKTKNWIDYFLFKTSPATDVHIGTHDWLYLSENAGEFWGTFGCSPEQIGQMRRVARQIHELEKLIEESGKQFVFLVAPNKETIYPEYLGMRSSRERCAKNQYDLFLESLSEYPIKKFIRLDSMLFEAKENGQIYFRTDTHWNPSAALIVSEEILRHISPFQWKELYPRVRLSSGRHEGDLSRMIGVGLDENGPAFDEIDYDLAQIRKSVTEPHPGGRDDLRYVSGLHSGRLPKAVLYRDSFSNYLHPVIAGAFEQLDVVWYQNYKNDLIIGPAHPEELTASKIVILEVVERWLFHIQIDMDAWEALLKRGVSAPQLH